VSARLWILALAWVAWCVLHSSLIALSVRQSLAAGLGSRARYYRLGYNALAAATFLVVLLYALSLDGPVVFDWWGAWVPITAVFLPASLYLFWAGARVYDMDTFLGLRQLRAGRRGPGLEASGGISRKGILGAIRHPWYTAGVLFLASGPKTAPALVTAIVLALYLLIGAFIEERKLVIEFGEAYRAYRRDVSMFLPVKWLRKKPWRRRGADA
jgi:protein-S-isoprenylcysteine O-methyltransferase Ste14